MSHRKPRALDLYCGAGGASMGLHRAGFEVTGVDIKPQKRYPFKFIQGDALEMDLEGYDLIWSGPICKRYSIMSHVREGLSESHPDGVPLIREKLQDQSAPYVIENVQGSPLLPGSQFLCGFSFGLELIRHRFFETNFSWFSPSHLAHRGRKSWCIVGHGGPANQRRWGIAQAREAMGIDWMSRDEIVEAIPPAYSEYIGRQLIQQIRR